MGCNAYVGRPRQGKSYEVVVNVVVPALAAGRRVVSNIAGLNYDLIREYLISEKGIDPEVIGELVLIQTKQLFDPLFWRTDEDEENGISPFIQPGDLLALDELWKVFPRRGDINPRAMNFFRMHGHMPAPDTGFICQIAIISQAVRDINENIQPIVDETYLMTKLTKLGFSSGYRVDVYQGASVSKSDFVQNFGPLKYNKKFFPFYKSHSQAKEGAVADERAFDGRGNILKNKLVLIGVPALIVLAIWCNYQLYRFFTGRFAKTPAVAGTPGVPGTPGAAGGVPGASGAPSKPENRVSDWRVVGTIEGDTFLVVLERGGVYRYISDFSKFDILKVGRHVSGKVDGDVVDSWTGQSSSSSSGPSIPSPVGGSK